MGAANMGAGYSPGVSSGGGSPVIAKRETFIDPSHDRNRREFVCVPERIPSIGTTLRCGTASLTLSRRRPGDGEPTRRNDPEHGNQGNHSEPPPRPRRPRSHETTHRTSSTPSTEPRLGIANHDIGPQDDRGANAPEEPHETSGVKEESTENTEESTENTEESTENTEENTENNEESTENTEENTENTENTDENTEKTEENSENTENDEENAENTRGRPEEEIETQGLSTKQPGGPGTWLQD
ncbi:uncharacterized protein DDB_G0290685-like [Drosophila elegans]|uniref:uncharacterized protein DDB_G0290685-like n=1 Tax=Drosophila elegans TaxID=30023 RepID=UPI001BC83CF8|nr:uncharacterized protein DDB_G0290685-like [Drosophila elegans]